MKAQSKGLAARGRFSLVGRSTAALAVVIGVILLAAPAGALGADSGTGSAFGVSASGLVVIPPTPLVNLPASGTPPQAASSAGPSIAGVLAVGALNAATSSTSFSNPDESITSSSNAATVDVLNAIPGTGLHVDLTSSTCTSSATGSTGSSTIAAITVAGIPVAVPPGINVPLALPALSSVLSLTANVQSGSSVPGSTTITVTALHITVLGTGQIIDVAQSQCAASGPDIDPGAGAVTVTGLNPTSGSTAGGTTVTVTGTGFTGVPTVDFGSSPATDVQVVNSTTLTATSPPGAEGTVPVTVSVGGNTSPLSPAGDYSYVPPASPAAPPTISGITPTSGSPSGGETIQIVGTNLCATLSVTFGGTLSPSWTVNAACTILTVTVPAGSGTVPVTVTTAGGSTGSAVGFTYIDPGYWMTASDGGVFSFGGAQFYGSMGGRHLNEPIVSMADTPDHKGYWLFASDGGVFAFGDAQFFGAVPGVLAPEGRHLNAPIVAAEGAPDGNGYRMFAADGGVFDFGDATFVGSLPGIPITPAKPVVAATSAPIGQGYWLVAGDGGIFTFGSATFEGSLGGHPLNAAIVCMSATPTGGGYWIFGSDGGVFNFGDAQLLGSMGGQHLNKPVVSGVSTSTGNGYWMFATDGGVFNFGDAPFLGSLGGIHLNQPIVTGVGF